MFKLIVGLGNPGRQYQKTRHNAGFWFLEGLALEFRAVWRYEPRFQGALASFLFDGQKVWLLKPETYMNKSGLAVAKLVRYYDLQVSEILVVHDELDFEAGIIRFKKNGGHAGHNGLRDIIAHLGSKEFCRLRVGIGRPVRQNNVADYVLSEPTKDEKERINQALTKVYAQQKLMLSGELEYVMNQLH